MKQRDLQLAQSIGRFFRWWATELSGCVQDILARLAPGWRRTATVYVGRQVLRIVDADPADDQKIVEVVRPDHGSETLPPLPDAERGSLKPGRRVRLVFDADFAFVKLLCLPLAALPHLKPAINLQLPKWVPMSLDRLATDFAIVALKPEQAVMEVELAALKRTDIEYSASVVRSWGLRLSSIHLAGPPDRPPRFRFVTSDIHSRRFEITRTDSILIGTAAALIVAALAVSTVQGYRAAGALDRAQLRTSVEAAIVLEQRQHLIARLEPLATLSSLERATSTATLLTDITQHVPQDSWLTTFEMKGRNLRLVGVSPDAAAVVKLLTTSALLANVELRSSTSAGVGSNKERFEITAELRGGA
jgi:general secretion pathway protein L